MKYLALAALCVLAVLRPDHVEPQTGDLVTQGHQALDADRPEDAIALFEKAVAAEPNNAAALAWLGSAQVRKAPRVGGMEAAVRDLTRVVTMKDARPQAVPDGVMPTVYLHLGLAYKRSGQPAAARAAWEKARALYPAAPEAAAIERELRSL
jgi:tetratricopeptide (TPR) repeat protein